MAVADPPPVARVGQGGQAGADPVGTGPIQGVDVAHRRGASHQGGREERGPERSGSGGGPRRVWAHRGGHRADADARSRASGSGRPTRRDSWSRRTGWGPRRFPPPGPGVHRPRFRPRGGARCFGRASPRPNSECECRGESRTGRCSRRTSTAPVAGVAPPDPLVARAHHSGGRVRVDAGHVPEGFPHQAPKAQVVGDRHQATPGVRPGAPTGPPGSSATGAPPGCGSSACRYAWGFPTRGPIEGSADSGR